MATIESHRSAYCHHKSSPADRMAAFTRAVRILRDSDQRLTLVSVAQRAASYLPESASPLRTELKNYSEEQLKQIGFLK